MKERLTEYFEIGNYTEKQNIIDISDKLPLFENGVIMGKAIDKLAEFEDFLEEHDCESLSDYTKQVRKEAFEELYKFCEEHHFSKYSIDEFLDQIQEDR